MIDAAKDFATLQAFIRGRLPEDERRAFEDRLVREPALVNELEQSLRMREGLRRAAGARLFPDAAPQRARFRPWLPALAAAASVVIALFLWVSRATAPAPLLLASLESRAAEGATSLVAAHFTFVSMRGSSVPDLDLPSAGLIEFRAAPAVTAAGRNATGSRSFASGRAVLRSPLATLADLAVGADGYVHCYADAARLTAGSYVLRVQARHQHSRARRRSSPSVCAPTPRTPPANLRQTSARDLDCQNSGNSHEFLQVVGLHRASQYAHHRKRRAVAQARGATGGGDLVDAALCVVGYRDRYINSAHRLTSGIGFRPLGRGNKRRDC